MNADAIHAQEAEVGFQNARITEEEYARNGLAAVDAPHRPMMTCSSQWTIDRERNVHARMVSRTVPPDLGPKTPFWLLYWKCEYAIFECEIRQHPSRENDWTAHEILVRLELPKKLVPYRADIVKDIEAVLRTYGTGGIHCVVKEFKLKLDVRV